MHGRADGPLPPYEQWLLGGPSSVRGFSTGSVRRRPRRRRIRSSCGCRSRRRCGSARPASPSSSIAAPCGATISAWPTPTGSRATAPACSPSRRCSSSGSTSPTARAAAPARTSAPACRSERGRLAPTTTAWPDVSVTGLAARLCDWAEPWPVALWPAWTLHRVDVEHVAVRRRRRRTAAGRDQAEREQDDAAEEHRRVRPVADEALRAEPLGECRTPVIGSSSSRRCE